MSSLYPGGLDSFGTSFVGTSRSTGHAAVHDALGDAVNKIEAELGINPSGSYASVLARLNAPVFDVKAYGALGDNATDDTSAVQAAADAVAAAGGGILYFPPGTYLVSTAIYIASGTLVVGAGRYATSVKRKANSFTATATANNLSSNSVFSAGPSVGTIYTVSSRGSYIGIRDLTIDGNKANQTYTGVVDFNYGGAHGFGCRFVDYVEVSGCRIQNTPQNGIFYVSGGFTYTHHNQFLACGSSNAAFVGLTKNAVSHGGNNTTDVGYTTVYNFSDNYVSGVQDESVQFGYAQDVIICRNHLYSSGDKAIEGDTAFAGGTNSPGNVTITDNFIRTTTQQGISVGNADNQKILIANNQIYSPGYEGILVTQTSESTYLVVNNVIESVSGGYAAGSASGHPAIYLSGHKVTVAGNKVYDCADHGVQIAAARNVTVTGNSFEQCKNRAISVNMAAATTVDNVLIGNNTIDTIDGSQAIYLSVNGTVLNFAVNSNIGYNFGNSSAGAGTTAGIRVDGSSTVVRHMLVLGNEFTDRRGTAIYGYGIDLNGCSSVTELIVDGNVFYPSNFTGINTLSKVSTILLLGPGNLWESVAGIRTTATNRAMQPTDNIVLSNGATLTHTLPDPRVAQTLQAGKGKVYTIRNIHASSACTVQSPSGNVDGAASVTVAAGAASRYVADGTNWWSA